MTAASEMWKVRVGHGYYSAGSATDMEVRVSEVTKRLLTRRGCLWRRRLPDEWVLVGFGGATFDADDILEVEVAVRNKDLPLLTDMEWPGPRECYEIKVEPASSVVRVKEYSNDRAGVKDARTIVRLILPVGKAPQDDMLLTELVFDAPEKYWEYCFLPRDGHADRTLRLEETGGKIGFSECQPFTMWGCCALKCRSTEKIRMAADYSRYRLKLYEFLPHGRKELNDRVPFPDYRLVWEGAKDTIYKIVYF